jgi:hypothetical protein
MSFTWKYLEVLSVHLCCGQGETISILTSYSVFQGNFIRESVSLATLQDL